MKNLAFLMILLSAFSAAHAQDGSKTAMADDFYSSGKIYVVIATISIIFIGLAIYLFTIDRRLKKLEKDR
ncbi:MAG: CcmD family protein [Mucilaginibacter polytrichastri]|nr:CcmD family protein [Mucilaginibacter polytrichastri]